MEVQVDTVNKTRVVHVAKMSRLMAISFPEQTGQYVGEDGSGISPLPVASVAIDVQDSGFRGIVSCWKMTLWQRLGVLFTGRVWMCSLGMMHPPVTMFTSHPFKERK